MNPHVGLPPVAAAGVRSRSLGLALVLLWCAGLGCVLAAARWGGLAPGRLLLLAASVVLAAAGLGWFWYRLEPRRLRWTGTHWLLQEGTEGVLLEVRLRVHLDLQYAMLLHCRSREAGQVGWWLWLQRGTDAAHWHLLRCAVHRPDPAVDPQVH